MPKPLPNPAACVFDLDGTLVNSLRDIADSLNYCLDLLGLPTRPADEYRYSVGDGVPMLCRRVLGDSRADLVPRLIELVRAVYRAQGVVHTRPYPGVPELVQRMRVRGTRLAVLSNKPHDMTVRVVRTFWPDNVFDVIYGYVEEQYRKPSPYYLLRICNELALAPPEVWMIGDTPTDVATAAAAGAVPIGVTWGFRPRAELEAAGAAQVVDRPEELGQ